MASVNQAATGGRYALTVTGPVFQQAVVHNLIIVGLSLVIQLPLSIGLAMLLNRKLRGRAFFRLVIFAPYVMSEAVTAVIWLLILQPGGFVDTVLCSVGLGGLVHLWLADTHLVLYTLFVVVTWKYIGFGIILLLAGLQGIPGEQREASALDGASRLGFFARVLLPLVVFNDTQHFTLPMGAAMFQTQYSQDTARVLAFTALSIVPTLGFFVFAERRIVGGLTGAVKG